ncbi:MAG: hypothetical protein EXR66_05185 [Dehalococcoidia bacterium]|nr:hypothetical protein [Dehalococcoidia bacterium]
MAVAFPVLDANILANVLDAVPGPLRRALIGAIEDVGPQISAAVADQLVGNADAATTVTAAVSDAVLTGDGNPAPPDPAAAVAAAVLAVGALAGAAIAAATSATQAAVAGAQAVGGALGTAATTDTLPAPAGCELATPCAAMAGQPADGTATVQETALEPPPIVEATGLCELYEQNRTIKDPLERASARLEANVPAGIAALAAINDLTDAAIAVDTVPTGPEPGARTPETPAAETPAAETASP